MTSPDGKHPRPGRPRLYASGHRQTLHIAVRTDLHDKVIAYARLHRLSVNAAARKLIEQAMASSDQPSSSGG